MDSSADILSLVPGEVIGSGSASLPDPSTATADEMTLELDAAHVGRVLITYRRARHRHGRSHYWSWRAVHAQRASP